MTLSSSDQAKRAAAARALQMVEPGMKLGLGTGSTAAWFVRLLAERVSAEALRVACVTTSRATTALAEELGLRTMPLDTAGALDLAVDGADEFDADLNLIKGGGAALLQEKIVASATTRMVVIADADKRVATLGAFPLPVEIVRFGSEVTRRAIEALLVDMDVDSREARLRVGEDGPLVTDEGHHIVDLRLGRIGDAPALARALPQIPGVVEHGLFIGMADTVVVGRPDGGYELIRRIDIELAEQMRNQDA